MYTKDQIQLILKEYRNNFDIKHSIFISNIKDHPQYNLLYKIYTNIYRSCLTENEWINELNKEKYS